MKHFPKENLLIAQFGSIERYMFCCLLFHSLLFHWR